MRRFYMTYPLPTSRSGHIECILGGSYDKDTSKKSGSVDAISAVIKTQPPIKVLLLASGYPRDKEDSAAIFLRDLAENLSKRGMTVHVLAPADKRVGTFIEGNLTVHRFQYFPVSLQQLAYGSGILPNLKRKPWLWIQVPFFLASMTASLIWLLRRERPDLIHAHWVLPQGLIAVLVKLLFKIPVISTAHGSDLFALKSRPMRTLKKFVLCQSNAWTANTQATSGAMGHDASIPKPHIIPMGVDVNHFESGQRIKLRNGIAENEFVLLFVGRLVEQKGLDNLLVSLTLLPSGLRCRTSLWVLGDGHDRNRLQQLAATLGISDRVRFWGHISHHLLADFYSASDLLVVPSPDYEGQGLVIAEAFAARLCVLAARVGGMSEVVEDSRTGVLVEPHNPHQLASAIVNLLGNKQLRESLAENAFRQAKNCYDWQKIARDFEALYRALL